MVDLFSIGLSHALLALALWILVRRDDLDTDQTPTVSESPAPPARWTLRTRA